MSRFARRPSQPFLLFPVQESQSGAFLHRGAKMRKGKAACVKIISTLAACLATMILAGVMCARAAAQAGCVTISSDTAVGGTIRACPVGPMHGPGILPGPRPRPRNTRPAPAAPDPAVAEINQGDNFYSMGNWTAALWHYRQALAAHPGDQNILNRIANANQQIQNAEHERELAEEAAERQRVAQERQDYAERTQQLASNFQNIMDQDFNASFDGNRQSAVLAEALPDNGLDFTPPTRPLAKEHADSGSGLPFTDPGITFAAPGKPVYFPVFKTPIAPNSAPARVLLANQSEVEKIDEQIRQAQLALRRLIETNKAGDEQRLEWEKESDEAMVESEKMPLKLIIDLIGAHVDDLKTADEEGRAIQRSQVLDRIASRSEDQASSKSLENIYGMLTHRNEDLERLGSEVELADKLDTLHERINNFSMQDTELTTEDIWDVISQTGLIPRTASTSKDLIDAAYAIYHQAASMQNLVTIKNNNEKILAAQARLQRLVRQLVLKKQAAKARAANPTQQATEAHP